ncbi:MAG: hypothetical protein SVM80_12150 [Halobacteriota archaeon]|nr:hypothetical protein [Halobacteriota archaeon]
MGGISSEGDFLPLVEVKPETTPSPSPSPTSTPTSAGGGVGAAVGYLIDTDEDGWSDFHEIHISNTDYRNPDTDGDGIIDSQDPYPLDPRLPVQELESTPTPEPTPRIVSVPSRITEATPEPVEQPPDQEEIPWFWVLIGTIGAWFIVMMMYYYSKSRV